MSDLVTFEKQGQVGVITVNNPPVNALSQGVRQGLLDGIAKGVADAGVTAMVIIGGGRTFIAGADIREFGKPPLPPGLHSVLDAIEGSSKPVVAAIHGTALGGGLEVCLACHYRVAVAAGRVGLPEIGSGSCLERADQRLPQVAGSRPRSDDRERHPVCAQAKSSTSSASRGDDLAPARSLAERVVTKAAAEDLGHGRQARARPRP
jgi:3-hydroxyacyl-CoA dehydrogenase